MYAQPEALVDILVVTTLRGNTQHVVDPAINKKQAAADSGEFLGLLDLEETNNRADWLCCTAKDERQGRTREERPGKG